MAKPARVPDEIGMADLDESKRCGRDSVSQVATVEIICVNRLEKSRRFGGGSSASVNDETASSKEKKPSSRAKRREDGCRATRGARPRIKGISWLVKLVLEPGENT